MSAIHKTDDEDEFPVGMRVLAVDNSVTCLKVLTAQLRKCKYHVTPINQAIKALELLRENKDKFDLVITGADMPEMDDFMLLKSVVLEVDLPVIILSSYGDKERVMKGIIHGACDYLLKPVPIEQLKNIWQHVFRRKRLDSKEAKTSSKTRQRHEEDVDYRVKPNKRRKEHNNEENENEEYEDEHEEREQQSEYSSTQKKPRVVWTPDLHRKFVDAVNKLGIDKAVPKKILELMDDERLRRENVASHLQKYRVHMKKVAIDRGNMVEHVGSTDSAYGRTHDRVEVQNVGPVGHHVNPYRPHPFGLCVPSSGIIPWGQTDSSISSINHDPQVLHEMQMPLEYCTMNLDSLANTVTTDFSSLNVNAARYCGGFGNNTLMIEQEHDLIAPNVSNFEDNRHKQETSSEFGGNMSSNSAQVIINPNDKVFFLGSAFNTLPDIKTYLQSQTQPISHDARNNVLRHQTFFPGDSSGVSTTVNSLSYEGHEFHTNDEVMDSVIESNLDNPFVRHLEHAKLTGVELLELHKSPMNHSYERVNSLEDLDDDDL